MKKRYFSFMAAIILAASAAISARAAGTKAPAGTEDINAPVPMSVPAEAPAKGEVVEPIPESDTFVFTFPIPVQYADEKLKESINFGDSRRIRVTDAAKPVLQSNGTSILVSNLSVMVLDREFCQPRFVLRPYYAGPNRIAIKIEQVDFGSTLVGIADKVGLKGKEKVLKFAVEKIVAALNDAFESDPSSKGMVEISYLPPYAVYVQLTDQFFVPFAPTLRINNMSLNRDEFVFNLGNADDADRRPREIAVDDNAINWITRALKVSNPNFMIKPNKSFPVGAQFGKPKPGKLSFSFGTKLQGPLHAGVTVTLTPISVGKNAISLHIDKVRINWLGIGGFNVNPLNIFSFLAQRIIVHDLIISCVADNIAADPELNRYFKVTQPNSSTVQLGWEKETFLYMFSSWLAVDNVRLDKNVMYLKYP